MGEINIPGEGTVNGEPRLRGGSFPLHGTRDAGQEIWRHLCEGLRRTNASGCSGLLGGDKTGELSWSPLGWRYL